MSQHSMKKYKNLVRLLILGGLSPSFLAHAFLGSDSPWQQKDETPEIFMMKGRKGIAIKKLLNYGKKVLATQGIDVVDIQAGKNQDVFSSFLIQRNLS